MAPWPGCWTSIVPKVRHAGTWAESWPRPAEATPRPRRRPIQREERGRSMGLCVARNVPWSREPGRTADLRKSVPSRRRTANGAVAAAGRSPSSRRHFAPFGVPTGLDGNPEGAVDALAGDRDPSEHGFGGPRQGRQPGELASRRLHCPAAQQGVCRRHGTGAGDRCRDTPIPTGIPAPTAQPSVPAIPTSYRPCHRD